jgi:dienelactone hydrolase
VRENGLFAEFSKPTSVGKFPGVIVLGGSRGGIARASATAIQLAEKGYSALALAYFRFESLPKRLKEIPLEYFEKAIEWMSDNPAVDSGKLALIGTSKGGEAALFIASKRAEIKAVVAYVPSHVAFQGIFYGISSKRNAKSSWTCNGKPVPFVPYRYDLKSICKYGILRGLYLASLHNAEAVERAAILVERINGPILLISGKSDPVWPSTMMCDRIIERLEKRKYPFKFRHISYDDAGHIPPGASDVMPASAKYIGGIDAANAFARDDAWGKALAFISESLNR